MFSLPPGERDKFCTQIPHGLGYETNRFLAVLTPVMFLYLADHLCVPGSKVREHLGRIGEIEIEVKTLGAFLQTIHYGMIHQLRRMT